MSKTNSYEKLEIWKESLRLSIFIYKNIQKSTWTDLSLIQQIRRSMTSVTLNIAEGMSRKTKKEKEHFLTIAFASCMETRATLRIIQELNDQPLDVANLIDEIGILSRRISAFRHVVNWHHTQFNHKTDPPIYRFTDSLIHRSTVTLCQNQNLPSWIWYHCGAWLDSLWSAPWRTPRIHIAKIVSRIHHWHWGRW